jgi:hypothetical protein
LTEEEIEMGKPKKVAMVLSKAEFKAMLLRCAEQDAEKWMEGMQWMLPPDDVAFIEMLRLVAAKKLAAEAPAATA